MRAAAVSLVIGVCLAWAGDAADVVTAVLAVAAFVVLLRFRVNAAWLLGVGAVLGLGSPAVHL